jgi:kojibiose phosphorylase
MLMYRHHTLPGARKRARELGCEGALYAWESTITGEDMTPTFALGRRGRLVPIVCGQLEQHISADVAFGVWNYWNVTRDDRFLIEAGAEILVETARFWATRVDRERDTYHIKYVEGPDEYHEIVDDNAYTNMMAALNLERAAEAVAYLRKSYPEELNVIKEKIGLDEGEAEGWLEVARGMYTGRLEGDGLIEQFAGFCTLEEFDVCEYEPRDAAMDVLLGREATQKMQVVKQADVVMLLYLLEDHFSEEAVRQNFEYYEARTAHDSSLSPSIYGLVAARLGLLDTAMRYFRQAGQVDLADNMGNAAGGVHAAALGGLWQQLVMGFVGLRAGEEGIALYPRLPRRWGRMSFSLLWRGCRLSVDVRRERTMRIDVAGKGGVRMAIYGRPAKYLKAGSSFLSEWKNGTWQDFTAVGRGDGNGR